MTEIYSFFTYSTFVAFFIFFLKRQIFPSLIMWQKKSTLMVLAILSLFTTALVIYYSHFHNKSLFIQESERCVNEKKKSVEQFLSMKNETTPTKIFFVTCNPGPAIHFAALGKSLDTKYKVLFIATGAGLEKLRENEVTALDFNIQQLDLTKKEVQANLAQQVARICSAAHIVIVDIGHPFSIHLQKELAKCQEINIKGPIFASYYDNTEKWVSVEYAEMASELAKVSQAIFFANDNLAYNYPHQDEMTLINLKEAVCIGVGYYPVEQAEKLYNDRLAKQADIRYNFFESLKMHDRGQKILVYLGENNSDYFDQSLPKFVEFLEESVKDNDLSHLIILFQIHPNAKARQKEKKLLANKEANLNDPLCMLSKLSLHEALILADAVAGRQTSLVPQIALAKIPYMQVGHVIYPDILTRNGLCPTATTMFDFLNALNQVFISSSDHSEIKENLLKELGIRNNWAQKFDDGLQLLLKQKEKSN